MKKSNVLSQIRVFTRVGDPTRGQIVAGNMVISCALGRGGTTHSKREGDGATPIGSYCIVRGWYRADRIRRPATAIPLTPIRPNDGWCDEPGHRLYNRPVKRPFPARHEQMNRDDQLYDIVIDLGWNSRPRIQGRGSAIFLHLAREDFGPTEGCIALPRSKIAQFLAVLGPHTKIIMENVSKPLKRTKLKRTR